MVLVVAIAFTISWTPYFLVSIITQYQKVNYLTRHNYFFTMLCINIFAFLNSSINPFIYVAMSTRFRLGFVNILRSVLCINELTTSEDTDQMVNVNRRNRPMAYITKYRQRMLMFACGETTQISTDSVPSEASPQLTILSAANGVKSWENSQRLRLSLRNTSSLSGKRLPNGICDKYRLDSYHYGRKIRVNPLFPESRSLDESEFRFICEIDKNVRSEMCLSYTGRIEGRDFTTCQQGKQPAEEQEEEEKVKEREEEKGQQKEDRKGEPRVYEICGMNQFSIADDGKLKSNGFMETTCF